MLPTLPAFAFLPLKVLTWLRLAARCRIGIWRCGPTLSMYVYLEWAVHPYHSYYFHILLLLLDGIGLGTHTLDPY
jgi:hypothetical protein